MTKRTWKINEPTFEADHECPMYRSWPWNGHRRFAYDLACFMRPKRIVELGTYWGTSFFAFCQAVKDLKLSTECIAIDTWQGDDHTGPYDSEPFETFQQIKNRVFSNVSIHPLKMRFKEALYSVEDNSIDLLHIDGCHDYDAVAEDYNTWLAKLKKNGIVLFHDVADACSYGSVKFWKEISRKKDHFTFQHSFGLGILFPKGDKIYHCMNENNFEDKMRFYESRSKLDLANDKIGYLHKRLEEFQEAFNKGEDMLKDYFESFKWAQDRIVASESIINEKLKNLAEKEAVVILHKKEIDENTTKIIDLQNRLQEALDRIEKTTESIPSKIKRLLSRKATFKD